MDIETVDELEMLRAACLEALRWFGNGVEDEFPEVSRVDGCIRWRAIADSIREELNEALAYAADRSS